MQAAVQFARELAVTEPTAAEGREATSIGDLFDRLGRDLLGYLRAILGREDLAEDALQETFVRLAARREELSRVANLRGYVFAAARNEAMRLAARESSLRAREDKAGLRPLIEPAADKAELAEDVRRLEASLRELPPEQREVVYLRCVDGFSFSEIAVVLSVPRDTAASRYRYGMEKLRKMMG